MEDRVVEDIAQDDLLVFEATIGEHHGLEELLIGEGTGQSEGDGLDFLGISVGVLVCAARICGSGDFVGMLE